jgi:hypothetical protein
MRHFMFVLVVLSSACAASQVRPAANIPAIRHQIDDTIAGDPSLSRRTGDFRYEPARSATADAAIELPASRKITAMGHVEPDRAVVYTHPGATKLEETWVRGPDGWKLAHVTELGDARPSTASR